MKVFSSKSQPKPDLIVILSIILTKSKIKFKFQEIRLFLNSTKNAEYLHLLEDFPKNHFESKTEVQLIHRVLVTYF